MSVSQAEFFDSQITERVANGHVPDLRNSGRCEYFYQNVWRDNHYVDMFFGDKVRRIIPHIEKYAPHNPRILEVGCGPGHITLELARNGFDAVGIDISGKCIEVARKTADVQVEYIHGNFLEHFAQYDVIMFIGSLHHFPSATLVIDHAYSLLNNGGLIIIDEPLFHNVNDNTAIITTAIISLIDACGCYYTHWVPKSAFAFAADTMKQRTLLESDNGHESNTGITASDLSAYLAKFDVFAFYESDSFYNHIIGGIRCETVEQEHKIAELVKTLDYVLRISKIVPPTYMYIAGVKHAL